MKKMKHLFSLLLLLVCVQAYSAMDGSGVPEGDTNYFYIEEGCTVQPGGARTNYIVAFSGDDYYTAYNIVFGFPEGIKIDLKNDGTPRATMYTGSGTPYPYTMEEVENEDGELEEVKEYTHLVASNVVDNTLRLGCYSVQNADFTKTNGRLFRVYFTASPYVKPGPLPITFTEQKFVKSDETAKVPTNYTSTAITVGTTSTITLNVSAANKFGTCILPFDAAIPEGLKVYSCSSVDGDCLVLTEQQSFAAYTPYILYAENGCTATLTGEVDATKYQETVTDGYISGTVVTTSVAGGAGNYVMQNKGNGPMFYKVGDTPFSLAPGKCWLTIPNAQQSALSFRFQDGTTGIGSIATADAGNTIYDLNGRVVTNMLPGKLYIQGGKKVWGTDK